jgi:hypothetical protein
MWWRTKLVVKHVSCEASRLSNAPLRLAVTAAATLGLGVLAAGCGGGTSHPGVATSVNDRNAILCRLVPGVEIVH